MHGGWTSKSRAQSSIARTEQKEENEPKMAAFKLPKPASSDTSNKATPLQPLQTAPQLGSEYSDACNWGPPHSNYHTWFGNTSDFCCHKVNRFLLTLLCCSIQEKSFFSSSPSHVGLQLFFLLSQPHPQSWIVLSHVPCGSFIFTSDLNEFTEFAEKWLTVKVEM